LRFLRVEKLATDLVALVNVDLFTLCSVWKVGEGDCLGAQFDISWSLVVNMLISVLIANSRLMGGFFMTGVGPVPTPLVVLKVLVLLPRRMC